MDSDDGEVEDARIENYDMEFGNEPETGGASSSAAGIDGQDTMVGMFTSIGRENQTGPQQCQPVGMGFGNSWVPDGSSCLIVPDRLPSSALANHGRVDP